MFEAAPVEVFETLARDPLFQRLWAVHQQIEDGRADPMTLKRWRELRDTVATIVRGDQAALGTISLAEREKLARDWIQAFTDEHWPLMTRH